MGAGLGARHALAGTAVEGVLELVRRKAESFRAAEFVEECLRVVRAVVIANSGRVPADDEMRAPVVPAYLPVVDGLARSCVAHCAREDSEHHTIGRVVAVEQHPVAVHSDLEGHVITLGHAGEGMQQESIDLLERDLGQVLVSPVHRIPCLESHHRRPPPVAEGRARFGRRGEHISRSLRSDANRAGDNRRSLREKRGDARMGLVRGPIDLAGLGLEVSIVDLGHGERPEQVAFVVMQGDHGALAQRASAVTDRQGDGKRPRRAVAELRVLDDALIVAAALKPADRRVCATAEQPEVGRGRL